MEVTNSSTTTTEADTLDISVVTSALHLVAAQLGTNISALVAAYQNRETARGRGEPKPIPRRGSSAFVSVPSNGAPPPPPPALPSLQPQPDLPLPPSPPLIGTNSSPNGLVPVAPLLSPISVVASRSGSVLSSLGKERRFSVGIGGVAEVIRGRTIALTNRITRVSELARNSRLTVNDMDSGAKSWAQSPEPPQPPRARSQSDMPISHLRQLERQHRSRPRSKSKGKSGLVESTLKTSTIIEDWSIMKKTEEDENSDGNDSSGRITRRDSISHTQIRSRGNSISSHREQEIKDGAKKRRERKAKAAERTSSPPPIGVISSIANQESGVKLVSFEPVTYLGAVQTQWK
jgi:hypothetical protein